MKILIFTPPFSGHLNVLDYLKNELEKDYNMYEILLVITGWTNINPINYNTNHVIILHKNNISSSDPMTFTLSRTYDLTSKCIDICEKFKPHLIIYDFFSIEGFITAKSLSIPCFCSIPAVIGPYNPTIFFDKLKTNQYMLDKIKTTYGINLLDHNIQQVSDGIFIPSDVNILWSYNKVIECDNYLENRNLTKNNFIVIGPRKMNNVKHNNAKKIIYISFGTVVMHNLWNHDKNDNVKCFIIDIFNYLVDILGGSEIYDVIVVGRKDIISNWPSNFKVCEYIDQLEILSKSHIFITHCGGNSFNESIHYNVPMIGIPFFGDQHLIGHKINKLGIGVALLHNNSDEYISTENNVYFRESLTKENLHTSIKDIETNYSNYLLNIKQIKTDKTNETDINQILSSYYNYPFVWKNGDLLYGTNEDRKRFIKYFDKDNDFRICRYKPFSLLFNDTNDLDLLPRIVDIYNDGLFDDYFSESNSKFKLYNQILIGFREFLEDNKQFIAPIKCLSEINKNNRDQVIWNMCLGGIEYFTQIKNYTIHFVLDSYSKENKATTLELEYIKSNWVRLKSSICFYKLDTVNGTFMKVNPLCYSIL